MNWVYWSQTFTYKNNSKQMFLILNIVLVPVSMIQPSGNSLDTCKGGYSRDYDFMIISNDYSNMWKCSNTEKNYCTDVGMFCNYAEGTSNCTIDHCQKRQEGCSTVLNLPIDTALCSIHVLEDFQRLGSFSNERIGCKYNMMNWDARKKFKYQPGSSVRNNTYHCDKHFAYQPNTDPKQQPIHRSEEVDSEAIHSKYYGQLFELTLTEAGVYCACALIGGFLLCCIIKLHICFGTAFCIILKKLLFPKDSLKEIRVYRADCQLSEGNRNENTAIESFSNCRRWPKGQTSRLCSMQPFQYEGKENSKMDKNTLGERAVHGNVDVTAQTSISTESEVKGLRVKQKTLEVTSQTSDGTEVENLIEKIGTVDIMAQTSDVTEVEDLRVKKGSCEVTAKTSLFTEVENLGRKEGTVKIAAKASNSTVEEDLTGKASVQVIAKANEQVEVCKFRMVEEILVTTIEASQQEEVESCRAECQVIIHGEELESYNNSIPSYELVKEKYFDDSVKIDVLNQPFLQPTCKSIGHKNEDRKNDLSCYQDIHKGRNQFDEFGEILESVKEKKKQSYRAKESDARNRAFTTAASQEWLKKNPDSDINLSFRDPALSEEKDKIAPCLQEDRKWPKSHPSVNGVQQEFTPVTSTEESVLMDREESFEASCQKYKDINDENSDNSSKIKERCSDVISLESEKKRKKSLCSELHFRTTGNPSSFVFHKSNMKYAKDLIHLKEGVKLLSCRKQVISLLGRAFFAPEESSLDQKKDACETEQQILSDTDVSVQNKKCGVEMYERTVRDIDLQEKKKHHLRQIVWLPRNWLPLPRLSRDVIVGFVGEQTHDGHGGSALPPAEHGELREMLRQLASDNIPGPQITMKYEMLRLCTMKSFPRQDRPFAIRIIGAGFYYAGHQDQVICYCCGNRKDSWVLGDIPLLIHQNMAPDCDFLTHNALVNVPIRTANSTESPSPAEVHYAIQRSDGSNQSDTAQGESSLMLPSSEQNRVNISNTPHQMLVNNKSSTPNQKMASGRQNLLDNQQTVSPHKDSVEEPPPKYPQYAVKNMRINSFQGWPTELEQKPEEMAECGFYYAGFSDCVRCFFCGVGLRHWMSEDDPWIEHARWSTSCIYVLKMKGEEFVSLVKMAVEIAEREEAVRNNGGRNQAPQNSNEAALAVTTKEVASNNSSTTNSVASQNITGNMGATGGNDIVAAVSAPCPGNAEIQKYLLTDAAQSVLDMGYQPKLVLRAIERVLLKKGTEELTGQIILEAVFEIEEENKAQPQPQTSTQSAEGNESSGKANMNSEASNKQNQQLGPGAEATENASSEELQIDPEKIMREHRELCEAKLCKICLENTISVVFLPCGHLVTCPDCAPAMRKCPICRTLIKGTVKTFYG